MVESVRRYEEQLKAARRPDECNCGHDADGATGVSPATRIAAISHTAISRAAGRRRYETLAAHHDFDVHLIVPERWFEYDRWLSADKSTDHGVNVHILPIRLPRAGRACWYLHFYPQLRRVLKELEPSVIHLWEEPWSFVAAQAAWLRNRYWPRAALVVETDQNILRRLPPPFETLRTYTLRNTDFLLYRNDEALTVARQCGYVGPAGIVEYGIDFSIFRPAADKDRLKAAGSRFTVGFIGRLVPEKGLEDILSALTMSCAPIDLKVLGDGPDKVRYEQTIASLDLMNRVGFFDPCAPAKVAEFIQSVDAIIMMSRTTKTWKEQFGRVIAEAHACGTPVIGSTSGSIPSVVGEGGWIVPEQDPCELARLLDFLAANPGRVALAGVAGRNQALSRFAYEKIARDLCFAYTGAIACRAANKVA